MSEHLSLTNRVMEACTELVEEHFASGVSDFDVVWGVVSRHFPGGQIEQLTAPLVLHPVLAPDAMAAIGDSSGQAVDVLDAVAVMVGAAVNLVRLQSGGELLDTAAVDTAIRSEANRLSVPLHVSQPLESHGVRLFANIFSAVDFGGPEATDVVDPLLWVEWREPASDARPSAVARTRVQVEAEFRKREDQFMLFVDETDGLRITVNGVQVKANIVPAAHRRLMYLVLHASKRSGVVTYDRISDVAMGNPAVTDRRIQHFKSEADGKLGGILKLMLTTKRGARQYEVQPISYCWIRYRSAESRLSA